MGSRDGASSLLAPKSLGAQAKPLSVLEGKLLTTRGDCPLLKMAAGSRRFQPILPIFSTRCRTSAWTAARCDWKELPKPDGSFEVQWLYTVHDGKLFKVRYFCATCNIVALEPGICVCCQQPTELQEIPVRDRTIARSNSSGHIPLLGHSE